MSYRAKGGRVLDGAGLVAAECVGPAAEAMAEAIAMALNPTPETEEDRNDRRWAAGHRAAWSRILKLAAAELDGEERKLAATLAELDDVRRVLRDLCEHFGDNDWPDDLHLGDALEKHLGRYLHDRHDDDDESERARLRE